MYQVLTLMAHTNCLHQMSVLIKEPSLRSWALWKDQTKSGDLSLISSAQHVRDQGDGSYSNMTMV